MENLKITFKMDGTGVIMYPFTPIHLDGLLMAVSLDVLQTEDESQTMKQPTRDGKPSDIKIPLAKWRINGSWGWHASALFPIVKGQTIRYWRKKFRQDKAAGMFVQRPRLTSGIYHEYNTPMSVILCDEMFGYAVGNLEKVCNLVKRVKYIGTKRSIGRGRVLDHKIEVIDRDYSLVKDGKAQRFLPSECGSKYVRFRPPYWNNHGRKQACNVGDSYFLRGLR